MAAAGLGTDLLLANETIDPERLRAMAACDAQVTVAATLRPGVATMPKGMWRRDGHQGFTANVFAPAHLSDLAGGASFNDARVEVSAASSVSG